jgi:hypothetical protein
MERKIYTNVGSDQFPSLRKNGYYFIDKSMFIKEFLETRGQVTLITRPRRFGKSLNLSMLKSYLEIGADPALFEGLAIEGEKEVHDKHFGKHPVLYLSLAAKEAKDFDMCLKNLSNTFKDMFNNELSYLIGSDKLSRISKDDIDIFTRPPQIADESFLSFALQCLVNMLYQHFGKEVVILIDEYDSMVTRAISKGYEKRLCEFLSGFFGGVFKGNARVEFVALTGCLRIAKESIFTGANNLVSASVSEADYSGMFGLTEEEVEKVLNDFGFSSAMDSFREWYDGYLFCDKRIYNTSSVMSHCKALTSSRIAKPQSYWANASSNDILQDIISKSESEETLPELESLLFGGSVEIELISDITLDDFDDVTSLWSVLVHSGYLTPCGQDAVEYRIPNKEIQREFLRKVVKWVKGRIGTNTHKQVVKAIWGKDTAKLKETLDKILLTKMSYFDSHEYCYHMLLLGLMADVDAESNRESGTGRTDITLKNGSKAAILELKKSYAQIYLAADALKGIMQIRDRLYGKDLEIKGFNVIHYGISFFKKECKAILESEITKELIAGAIGDMEAAVWAINWQTAKREAAESEQPLPESRPYRKAWHKGRKEELDDLKTSLDKESKDYDFYRLLKNTEKLLEDLRWLQKTEAAKSASQTLMQAMLTQDK